MLDAIEYFGGNPGPTERARVVGEIRRVAALTVSDSEGRPAGGGFGRGEYAPASGADPWQPVVPFIVRGGGGRGGGGDGGGDLEGLVLCYWDGQGDEARVRIDWETWAQSANRTLAEFARTAGSGDVLELRAIVEEAKSSGGIRIRCLYHAGDSLVAAPDAEGVIRGGLADGQPRIATLTVVCREGEEPEQRRFAVLEVAGWGVVGIEGSEAALGGLAKRGWQPMSDQWARR
ncbi:hypothetical protein BH23VER1_BH23VER1_02420 [soil metagenome]